MRLFGLDFLTRPITMGLMAFVVAIFSIPLLKRLWRRVVGPDARDEAGEY